METKWLAIMFVGISLSGAIGGGISAYTNNTVRAECYKANAELAKQNRPLLECEKK
jgi:hypothetical protein